MGNNLTNNMTNKMASHEYRSIGELSQALQSQDDREAFSLTDKRTGTRYGTTPNLFMSKTVKGRENRLHILALGDVGATLLLGLKLMGGQIIDTIGIYDINPEVLRRYEMEMNQIGWGVGAAENYRCHNLPRVEILEEKELFNCDMFVFCASKGVPPVKGGADAGDVRMVQFEENRKIVKRFAEKAGEGGFDGIFAVVSDPVDPLCKVAITTTGLKPAQVRGYGLGVMNRRAMYFAEKEGKFQEYLTCGRAFGPHGEDLVIANSIKDYNDNVSRELTELTATANLQVRELGFKPFIAPAISSGALSIIATLKGEDHYSAVFFGDKGKSQGSYEGAFLGVRNRMIDIRKTDEFQINSKLLSYGRELGDTVSVFEDLPLPQLLFERVKKAYDNLCGID